MGETSYSSRRVCPPGVTFVSARLFGVSLGGLKESPRSMAALRLAFFSAMENFTGILEASNRLCFRLRSSRSLEAL